MARNGVGIYNLPAGQPVVTGTSISSTVFNTLTADLANALTTSLASDGQTAMAANLPMGGNKLTGLAAGTTTGDSVRYEQISSIFAVSLAANGYQKLPSGLIIQWGFTTIAVAGVAQADPFPLPWPTGCYRMAGSMGNTGSAVTSAVNIGPLSTTQYRTVCATTDVVSWIAVGT